MKTFDTLAERWETDAARLRSYGAEGQAMVLDRCVTDLRDAVRDLELETVTLEEAATLGGYSYSHLQTLVADGTIENVGEKHAPRIRRIEVPKKPGHDGHRGEDRGAIIDRSLRLHREGSVQ